IARREGLIFYFTSRIALVPAITARGVLAMRSENFCASRGRRADVDVRLLRLGEECRILYGRFSGDVTAHVTGDEPRAQVVVAAGRGRDHHAQRLAAVEVSDRLGGGGD